MGLCFSRCTKERACLRVAFFFFSFLFGDCKSSQLQQNVGGLVFLPPFGQPARSVGFLESSAMWEPAARLQSQTLPLLGLVGNGLDEKPPKKAQAGSG